MFELLPTRQIALAIGTFNIHWYGLLYLVAFIQAYLLLPRLQKYAGLNLTRDTWFEIVAWGAAAAVAGGRLGYVLLYEPRYFLMHPAEIAMLWQGGMSSHGGILAVVITLALVARARKINIGRLFDAVAIVAGIGLALGRLGNFINYELFGPPTNLPWGVTLPGETGPRHPTPLYAVAKDLLIAAASYLYLRFRRNARPGQTAALAATLYGILRFIIEYVRIQEFPGVSIGSITLTYGQVFTIPVVLGGLSVYLWLERNKQSPPPS